MHAIQLVDTRSTHRHLQHWQALIEEVVERESLQHWDLAMPLLSDHHGGRGERGKTFTFHFQTNVNFKISHFLKNEHGGGGLIK